MLEWTDYTTGPLNQVTCIERGQDASMEAVYDEDSNETVICVSTGVWQVSYNAENRPVRFVNERAKTVLLVCTTCFNRFATKTNAYCIVATCTYEQIRGLLARTGYCGAKPV